MRKPVIAGNWKLNKTIKEAIEFATLLKRSIRDTQSVDVILCPVYMAISEVSEALRDTDFRVGGQDLYWEEKGAFTGEVSASLLKDAGASHVIIGHSERRQFFHETHETVNRKTKAALNAGLTPIVCVGESLAEREKNLTRKVLEEQLTGGLAGFGPADAERMILAYEPVWAIGTGKVASPVQAQEAHAFIRGWLKGRFGVDIAQGVRIQYGGSVKPDNISDLMREEDIDGALVGGASLDAQGFTDIIKNAQAALFSAGGGPAYSGRGSQ
jgi:triosephosphate isomerase